MNAALDLAVDVAATARLTRLIVSDTITTRPRRAFLRRWPAGGAHDPGIGYLVTCERCASVWAALAITTLRGARPWTATGLLRMLAVAELAAPLATRD